MFWKASVPISEYIHQTAGPAMGISRCFGLFPFTVYKQNTELYLKWSPLYAFYSFILGVALFASTYQGLLDDVFDKDKSIRIKSRTEMYVMFCDITVVQLVMIFGIFVHAFKFRLFFKFIDCLNEVDAIITPKDAIQAKNKSLAMVIAVLTTSLCMMTADTLTYFETENAKGAQNFVVKRYLSFYITYVVILVYQYQFWHLGQSILRRLRLLNKHLENVQLTYNTTESDNKLVSMYDIFPKYNKLESKNVGRLIDNLNKKNREVLNVKAKVNVNAATNSNLSILKMAAAYIHLRSAVDCLNQLLGTTHAVTLIGILWHLIESPFHVLMELSGSRRDMLYIAMNTAWCFYHLGRLLIIVEPCNSCTVEGQTTRNFVCKLLCTKITDHQVKSELELFSAALLQCKIEFSAAGLTTIDRSLVTAFLGTITTYLVILLQYQNN